MFDYPYPPETYLPYLYVFTDLFKSLAWPLAVLLIFVLLRTHIANLLSRVPNLSAAGLSVVLDQKQDRPPSSPEKDILSSVSDNNSIAFKKVESAIRNDLLKIDPDEREDILVRLITTERLTHHFSFAYSQIFGSQIGLLRLIEAEGGSISLDRLDAYYRDVRSKHQIFDDLEILNYVRFLEGYNFVLCSNSGISITDFGQDFLRWMAASGLTDARPH